MILPTSLVYSASRKNKKKDQKKEQKKETAYEKIFKDKECKTVKGLITLHKIDGKVYFEFPVNLLGKKMLLGSMVEAISNSDYSIVGQQPHTPLCIYFTQADSSIQIREANFLSITDEENVQRALDKNTIGPILSSFKIKALSPDSTAVVFDATKFFVGDKREMDPFSSAGGLYSRTNSFKKSKSLLGDIMAFEDNVSISSHMSYEVTSTFFGFVYEDKKPATALMKRSLMLLPEEKMRPRINDPRIGVFYNGHMTFSGEENGMKPLYYANRWKLEPKDVEAFKKGELTEPIKPILFYIDDKFPPSWIQNIRAGVENWNKAYEKFGFKNAIVTKMYPKNDPNFDPNNIKFNCVKYAPTLKQNSMGPSWIDPRTGEILNASIYMYHGMADLLGDWLFFQTSVPDKRVRTMHIPDDIMGDAIRYIATHEMGHCLGLMHNMGASFAFPVDSLRSPTFTQKYGTTPSIMDYARFNFVAQAGDLEKGVKLMPPELGVYDEYVIKWLYKPIYSANTSEEEVPVLESWISEKINDPMYKYGRQQIYTRFDPSAQTEDLGDDQVKATTYAMNNLKYIMENFNGWVKDEDHDFAFRKRISFSIVNIQYYWYLTHVLANIGGVYQYEKYEGDPGPAYRSVPEDVQRESILFLLDALENSSWLNNAELQQNIGDIYGNASEYMRRILFPFVMRYVANIGFSEAKSFDNPYTQSECIKDVFDYVWGSTIAGQTPSKEKLSMQKLLVKILISKSKVDAPLLNGNSRALSNLTDDQRGLVNLLILHEQEKAKLNSASSMISHPINNGLQEEEVSGFGFLQRFVYQTPDITHIYYGWLLQSKSIIEKAVKAHKGELKQDYEYLLVQINNSLKVD